MVDGMSALGGGVGRGCLLRFEAMNEEIENLFESAPVTHRKVWVRAYTQGGFLGKPRRVEQ